MKIAVIVSSQDPAGLTMKECLLGLFSFKDIDEKFNGSAVYVYKNLTLYTIEEKTIYAENIDKSIDSDFFVFCSMHRAQNQPLQITCHPAGNWGKAELGGQEKTLNLACASYLKELFIEQNKCGHGIGRDITLEATHHGPYIEKPCLFIETGNDENGWSDKKAGEANARAIVNTFTREPGKYKIAIGLGGLHYPSSFNRRMLHTDIAISHICPKYSLDKLDREMLQQAVDKTVEKVDFILLDWKGLGTEKQRIVNLLKEMKLEYKKTEQV